MVTIERQDRIAIVRFDRGTRANPMSAALLRELTKAARSFEDDDTLAAVVLTGTAENVIRIILMLGPSLQNAPEFLPDSFLALSVFSPVKQDTKAKNRFFTHYL